MAWLFWLLDKIRLYDHLATLALIGDGGFRWPLDGLLLPLSLGVYNAFTLTSHVLAFLIRNASAIAFWWVQALNDRWSVWVPLVLADYSLLDLGCRLLQEWARCLIGCGLQNGWVGIFSAAAVVGVWGSLAIFLGIHNERSLIVGGTLLRLQPQIAWLEREVFDIVSLLDAALRPE